MSHSRRARRSPVSRRVESLLELPDGVLGHCTRMELIDNRQAILEGGCAVLDYEDTCVRIAVTGGAVRFWGHNLQLNCLTDDSVLLTGTLSSMEFLDE